MQINKQRCDRDKDLISDELPREGIGIYINTYAGFEIWYELDTNELIGISRQDEFVKGQITYRATYLYKWDGQGWVYKTKTIRTEDYGEVVKMLKESYKNDKKN